MTKNRGKNRPIPALELIQPKRIFVALLHHTKKNHEKINHRSYLFNRLSYP